MTGEISTHPEAPELLIMTIRLLDCPEYDLV